MSIFLNKETNNLNINFYYFFISKKYRSKNMKKIWLFLITFNIINFAFALYERGDVVELTPATFKSRVLDSNEVWIVEFCKFD